MNQPELDFKIEKPKRKISLAGHRSKYPDLRGLDSQGPEYRKRYSQIRRQKNAKPKRQKRLI